MVAFVKSDLFLRFFGGFILGSVGMFALNPSEPPALVSPAMAASDDAAPAHSSPDAAL